MNLRDLVFTRDRGICAKCELDCDRIRRVYFRIWEPDAKKFYGQHVGFNGKVFWEADHIMERALHQDNSMGNMQTLCMVCHRRKTTLFMREQRSVAMVVRASTAIENQRRVEAERKAKEVDWDAIRESVERSKRHLNGVIDFVNQFIAERVAKNPDWPKAIEPVPADSHYDHPETYLY